jgi:hypothetical protein
MSLSRLALRLAAYEALNPFATMISGPWPTIAGEHIYDSRATPFSDSADWGAFLNEIEGKPIVILYTEEHEIAPTAGEYPADKDVVDLVAELMIAAQGQVVIKNADGSEQTMGAVGAQLTSREHEAMLDWLEWEVVSQLNLETATPSNGLYQKVAREWHHGHSVPQRDADKAVRFAARTVRLKLRVPHTLRPQLPANPPATGLALLPGALGVVAAALDPQSTGGRLCAKLAATLISPPAPPALADIRITANMNRGATPTPTSNDFIGDVPFSS